MTAFEAHRAVEAVWRIESAKIIARLARMVGDVGLAQDALVSDAARSSSAPGSEPPAAG